MFAELLLVVAVASGAEPEIEVAPPPREVAPPAKTYPFEAKDKPWGDVLDWYAETCGLTPILTVSPTGKFTFTPPKDKQFTLAEVTDILNEDLAKQKLILVRRQVTFTILPTDEPIDMSRVRRVTVSELAQCGKTEVVILQLHLKTLTAEEAAPEVEKMLTPLGAVSTSRNNTLILVDTAENVRRILQVLKHPDGTRTWEPIPPPRVSEPVLRKYPVAAGKAEEVANALAKLAPTLRVVAVNASDEVLVYATPGVHDAIATLIAADSKPAAKEPDPEKK